MMFNNDLTSLVLRRGLDAAQALALAEIDDLPALMMAAAALRDRAHGRAVSYSRKVFIPLTHLCRDVCHYCTFARSPDRGANAYLSADEAVEIARKGADAGCREALFTLGDKPELRWDVARDALKTTGFASTVEYLAHVCDRVRHETGLLPHVNPGVMNDRELMLLRRSAISMGVMLESASTRLQRKGAAHYGSPDKDPSVRLSCIESAGRLHVPFTSGILIGIGETRRERIEALLALRSLHERYGHLQEIIIQNFLPKAGTRMAKAAPADHREHLWTVAVARLILGGDMNIQAPPNLSPKGHVDLLAAGINDWGGVSPVTIDYVNPEAPWPQIDALAASTADAGKILVERLAIYPNFIANAAKWVDGDLLPALLRQRDSEGLAREDNWLAGSHRPIPTSKTYRTRGGTAVAKALSRAEKGDTLDEDEVVQLFKSRGTDFDAVCRAADEIRRQVNGDTVRYVVNRNINYTNVCTYACKFCAFSKGSTDEDLRGAPYDLDMGEFARRVREAWARGATEVCLQGGIHPAYTGETYLNIVNVAKSAAPQIHVHAFSPLEIWQGAHSLGLPLEAYLRQLKEAGLGSLPGTAAEILDDDIRKVICPDKVTTREWFEVMEAAHRVGLRSTATIMFGHVDGPQNWARHLLRLRSHQELYGGFTEFVPLPFVATEAPMFLKNLSRFGPTWREAVLMHAVGRLVLHPVIPNIQTSWVKMGPEGALACLRSGANDLGGTLMNESITRAAGAVHGQEFAPAEMSRLILRAGRHPEQRTTLYGTPPSGRVEASFVAPPLLETVNTPLRRRRTGPDASTSLPTASVAE